MKHLIDMLAPAAARGVEVTIVTNEHPPAPLTLLWAQKITSCYALLTYKAAGYELEVMDCDGDRSTWQVKRHGKLIASGSRDSWKPYYHCDQACLAAEEALRLHVRARVAELRGRV